MKQDDLQQYELDELRLITARSAPVKQRGHISTPQDLYPDLTWPINIAYRVGSIPLYLLVLLADKLVTYIPPSTPEMLEARWGLSFDVVLDLCERGRIQPLIGHPTDYQGARFDRLFRMKPPSVWARGLGLARALGMEHALEEAGRKLPLEKMARAPWLRPRWRAHFPHLSEAKLTHRISHELAVNYADLCVFGFREIGESTAYHKTPEEIARALLLAAEVKTYPILFGLGGTPHYDYAIRDRHGDLADSLLQQRIPPGPKIPPNLDILLRGIGINAAQMDAEQIVEFHASDAGKHLRSALQAFEAEARRVATASQQESSERVGAAAEQLQSTLQEATRRLANPSARKGARAMRGRFKWYFRAGGFAAGALVASISGAPWLALLATGAAGVAVAEKLLPASVKDRLYSASLAQAFSPGIAHLWKIADRRNTSGRD